MHDSFILQGIKNILPYLVLVFRLLQGTKNHIFDGSGPMIINVLRFKIEPIAVHLKVLVKTVQNNPEEVQTVAAA